MIENMFCGNGITMTCTDFRYRVQRLNDTYTRANVTAILQVSTTESEPSLLPLQPVYDRLVPAANAAPIAP